MPLHCYAHAKLDVAWSVQLRVNGKSTKELLKNHIYRGSAYILQSPAKVEGLKVLGDREGGVAVGVGVVAGRAGRSSSVTL
jgi:hypothetical protein